MRKALVSVLTLILSLCVFINVFAVETIPLEGNTTVSYEVNLGNDFAGKNISLTVLKPSVTVDNFIIAEDINAVTVAYLQGKTDENGKYTFEFGITSGSNHYPAVLGVEGEDDYTEYDFFYVDRDENAKVIEKITAEDATANDIEEILKNDKYNLGYNETLSTDTNISTAAKIVYNHKDKCTNLKTTKEVIEKAFVIAGFAKDKSSIFGDNLKRLVLNEKLNSWLTMEFISSDAEKDIENKIRKEYLTFSEFEDALTLQTVLTVVEYASGYGYVRDILGDYGEKYGIGSGIITTKSCNYVLGNTYNTAKELKDALESQISTSSKGSAGSGGNRGGAIGGGGTSFDGYAIQAEKNQTAEPYETVKTSFDDLSGYEWATDAINGLKEKGIVSGDENGKFNPGNTVLREEFLKMLMESVKFADIQGEINFSDVEQTDWYYPYIKNAFNCKIVSGISNDLFGTGRPISRQDMSVMICNALKAKGKAVINEKETSFSDKTAISDYALEAVSALNGAGIIMGNDKGEFMPLANATRAEAAQVIYRVLNFISE